MGTSFASRYEQVGLARQEGPEGVFYRVKANGGWFRLKKTPTGFERLSAYPKEAGALRVDWEFVERLIRRKERFWNSK